MISSFVVLFASAALVAAHGTPNEVVVDGTWYPGTKNWDSPDNQKSPVRGIPLDTGFVRYNNVNSPDIACSSAGYVGRPVTAPIPAGGTMGVRWGGDGGPDGKQWPHPEGPAIVYMASCEGECSKFNPTNAKFFKIAEEGLDTSKKPNAAGNDHTPAGQGLWAQNRIQYENSYHWFTIPSDIKAGEYLVRHELISLHGAHTTAEGAQYYPTCVQVKVTGGGNASPPATPATQLYTDKDGIIDIWANGGIKSYNIPGPALYKSGSGSSNPAPATTKAVTSSVAPTTTKPAANNNNGNPTTAAEPAATTTTTGGSKSCKAKRAARRSVADESRALYDRALAAAGARHAHGLKRHSH